MSETKTGALVCKTPDNMNQLSYRPLAFITDIPDFYTDEDLRINLDLTMFADLTGSCSEILFRADIHSTSNEVQEEFEKLHNDSGRIPHFLFKQKQLQV